MHTHPSKQHSTIIPFPKCNYKKPKTNMENLLYIYLELWRFVVPGLKKIIWISVHAQEHKSIPLEIFEFQILNFSICIFNTFSLLLFFYVVVINSYSFITYFIVFDRIFCRVCCICMELFLDLRYLLVTLLLWLSSMLAL